MYTLEVITDKLNIRDSPDADPTFGNWVGELPKGAVFNAVGLVKGSLHEGSNLWLKDHNNHFISAAPSLVQQWWQSLLKIDELQKLTLPYITSANPVRVAVIDTGLNGSKDILSGFNVFGSKNFMSGGSNVDDETGHGTLCASLIAGNTIFKGVNPRASLFIAKAFGKNGTTNQSLLTAALTFLSNPDNNLGIDLISISGGINEDLADTASLDACFKQGIIVNGAIGNLGFTMGDSCLFPARHPKVLGIGALNEQNGIASDINPGACKKIDYYLPGKNVHAINLSATSSEFDGTSQACAIMSGICSLVMGKVKAKKLNWKLNDYKQFFNASADKVTKSAADPPSFKLNVEKLLANFNKI